MGQIKNVYQKNEMIKKSIIVIFAGVVIAVALNLFLIPANVFSAGVNGIAQLISGILATSFGINLDTGILIFIMNVPIAVLGWIKLGKSATIFSLLTVLSTTIMTLIIPIIEITDNQLMNGIVGGVLTGVAVGTTMKYGFSTGGMDIVSLVLSKTTGRTVGSLMMIINVFIIATAGFVFDWESALFTIISIYGTTQVVDMIHTSHQKVTAFIMTSKPEEAIKSIQEEIIRGMTLLPGTGVYTRKEVPVIMMVVTKYELYALEQAVYMVDQNAFINILPTQTVYGSFWNEDQQNEKKKMMREAMKEQ
ncbi:MULTISPECIES: YitT family protein [Vagococcus]|uniref:Membrane protein, putative n=1 Tax=Vagococcus fluvialis bH819 TaxID=1255619 RepID=A0A1X6WRA8_9ENTE|nr:MULTISPECIES: YitT family protein [Vagococcus]SLM86805.1 membrane protein, putative [Vagococcus fluvialis bH819]HCM88737.1 YitT family protein [Vagococcus sp.]